MTLPIINIPAEYTGARLMLREPQDGFGRSTVLMMHQTLPTLWFDEVQQQWRHLVGHVSEIRHGE